MEINRQNYESIFLLYLDKELNPGEQGMVEKFLNEHPDLKKEFLLLQQTVFAPEEIVFDHKESLYRKEDSKKIIPIYWARIAAAVAVFLFGTWLLIGRINSNPKIELADKKPVRNNPETARNKPAANNQNPGKENSPAAEEKNSTATNKNAGKENDLLNEENEVTAANQNAKRENASIAEENEATAANQNAKRENVLSDGKNNKNGKFSTTGENKSNDLTAQINTKTNSGQKSMSKTSSVNQIPVNSGKQLNTVLPAGAETMVVSQKEAVPQNLTQSVGAEPAENISTVKNSAVGLEPVRPENLNTASAVVASATAPLIVDNAYGKPEKNSNASYAVENDNAISVIALNENNKAITGFFKKLTRQKTPTNDKERKLRVSVFQISY